MSSIRKTVQVAEFGDFQTPLGLAKRVCTFLAQQNVNPRTIVEPTCGKGSFLKAAVEQFTDASKVLGIEISPAYVEIAKECILSDAVRDRVEIKQGDFFAIDHDELFSQCAEPILVIGNPPWVTNSTVGTLRGSNLPDKSNFQGRRGFDAITGKANFDISEWMLIRLLEALHGRAATVAMLCKTIVARKVLCHAWNEQIAIRQSSIHCISADKYFGAAVEACLLVCNLAVGDHNRDCPVYAELRDAEPSSVIGFRDGMVLANVQAYERWKHLRGGGLHRWRSGVKHDCGKVMELWNEGKAFRNGLNEVVDLDRDYVYPMLKSSQVACGSGQIPQRWMLITQRSTGEDTSPIEAKSPNTWRYLLRHADALDGRGSSIYRRRPRFSIFGIGDYAFAPWKVAISGFYKKLCFSVVGPYQGKPVVLDDTSYFLPCQNEEEAMLIHSLLSSEIAKEFFSAYIFWDAKRPITVEVLQQLNLPALAQELGLADSWEAQYAKQRGLFE